MKQLSFGVFDHIERSSGAPNLRELYEERLQMLEVLDRAGFYSYHLAQHHATPLGMAPSPNLFLAAASQRTTHIRLGPLVYLLPFYNPLRLAEEIAMLDHLTGGRLDVGVGRGVSPFESAQHRIPFYELRDIYQEALEVLARGLSSERLTHRGHYFRYENVPMELRPLQQPYPPFWYGANSPDSARYAARRGMHMVIIGSDESARRLIELYREEHARSFSGPENLNPHIAMPKAGLQRHIYIADTDREAEEVARGAYQVFYNNIQKLWRDFMTIVLAFPPEYDTYRKASQVITGSVSSVRDQLARSIEKSGSEYLVLSFAWGNLSAAQARRSLDLFVTKVMPEFVPRPAAAR